METRRIPDGLVVFREGNAVVIRRRWERLANLGAFGLALFTALSSGVMFTPRALRQGDAWDLVFFFLGHLGPVLIALYFGICSLFNRTDVVIRIDRVKTVSTPLPWWGDRNVRADEIRAVTVKEVKKGEDGAKFALMYVDRNGKQRELVRAGKERGMVEFIGQAISDILGVETREATKGEFFPLHDWLQRFKKNRHASIG